MHSISEEEFYKLTPEEIAHRIDNFFQEDAANRYPSFFHIDRLEVTALKILDSNTFKRMQDSAKSGALKMYFRAKYQHLLCQQYMGLANERIYLSIHHKKINWENPSLQIAFGAYRQSGIIAARIAFECLMEFVYLVEVGSLIPSKKSKRRKFLNWVWTAGNRFGWMVYPLIVIDEFDSKHRQQEVHGTSQIAMQALRCEPGPDLNSELEGANLVRDVWHPILVTLNDQKPIGHAYMARHHAIFDDFIRWSEIDLQEKWKKHTTNSNES